MVFKTIAFVHSATHPKSDFAPLHMRLRCSRQAAKLIESRHFSESITGPLFVLRSLNGP